MGLFRGYRLIFSQKFYEFGGGSMIRRVRTSLIGREFTEFILFDLQKGDRSHYIDIRSVWAMTSVSFCEKCNSLRFKFDEKTNEVEKEGDLGMKSSCCGKCSNMNCVDYGECTCFDRFLEQRREFISNMIKNGKFPFINKE